MVELAPGCQGDRPRRAESYAFHAGQAFRPVHAIDAAVLTILRRDPPVLPFSLAPGFRETLRSAWDGTLNREPPLRAAGR